MLDIQKYLKKAKTSSYWLWIVNLGMSRVVPFNRPHRFKIVKLTDAEIETKLPYKRLNLNHIKSIHACALATLSEFTSGAFLISRFGMAKYRIILRSLSMEYHYQGKTDISAKFGLSDTEVKEQILNPLETSDSVDIVCIVKAFDQKSNHISTGTVTWQVKEWQKVRTKL